MKYLRPDTRAAAHAGYQQQVKESNIKRIFDLVRSGKCKSRAEIVRFMDLSATSVSVLVEELASRGLISETGPTQTSLPGRRPISLRLNDDARQLAVFTLQRQNVRYTLLNLRCDPLETGLYPIDLADLSNEEAGEAIARLFEDILLNRAKRFDPEKALMIGVSFPGIYARREGVFHAESSLGVALPEGCMQRFMRRIGLPIYLSSVTRSLAYAEKKHLEAAGDEDAQDMLYVELQDRVSSATISCGDICSGPLAVAGEIGHLSIDHQGRPCHCGSRGCLERYVSQRAIIEDARQAAEAAGIEAPGTLAELGRRCAAEGALLESVKRSARLLAAGLFGAMCVTGMRRVVLGGGIEALGEPFLREVEAALRERALLIQTLNLAYAQAGPNAESIGIAQHYLDKLYTITM